MGRTGTGLLLVMGMMVAGCGGKSVTRSCDEHTVYRTATENTRVQAPDGLSQLDPEREMVLPDPSPQQPRPADAPCLDLPPAVQMTGDDGDSDDE